MAQRKKHSIFLVVLTGFLIGAAGVAPGISGGAIAVILGLYEPITEAIGSFWKDFGKKVRFLAPLGIGAGLGMLLCGQLVQFLFATYTNVTCAVFLGLILGTLPSVVRTAASKGFRWYYLFATVLCAVLVWWMTTLEGLQYAATDDKLPYWWMLVCGGILGLGSVLPGTSFSFVLMALGVYEPMLRALSPLDIPRLLVLGIGFCVVFVLFARLLSWVYKKAYGWMSFAVFGMLIGSIFPVLPIPSGMGEGAVMLLLAVGAAVLSYLLLRIKE